MSGILTIHSAPTFRMGVLGTVLLFLSVLLGLVANSLLLLAIIPSVSLLLGWKEVSYIEATHEIKFTDYTLLIPIFRTFPADNYNQLFLEYQWEADWINRKPIRRLLFDGSDEVEYNRYFDLQLRGADNKKLSLVNFADYQKATEILELLAHTLNLPFTDDFHLRNQSAKKRREEYEKRRRKK